MGRLGAALAALASLTIKPGRAECNLTRYREWYESDFTSYADEAGERISVDREVGFWGLTRSGSYFDYTMSFGIVMERSTKFCRESLKQLHVDIAGRHGGVHAYDVHGSMCSDYCVDSDVLHIEAMRQSGCDCMELSLSETGDDVADAYFSREGEFCHDNSARILCEELDICGVWDCRLGDFMCPRHEYNKRHTRFRGLGDCSAAASNWRNAFARYVIPPAIAIALVASSSW